MLRNEAKLLHVLPLHPRAKQGRDWIPRPTFSCSPPHLPPVRSSGDEGALQEVWHTPGPLNMLLPLPGMFSIPTLPPHPQPTPTLALAHTSFVGSSGKPSLTSSPPTPARSIKRKGIAPACSHMWKGPKCTGHRWYTVGRWGAQQIQNIRWINLLQLTQVRQFEKWIILMATDKILNVGQMVLDVQAKVCSLV